jgi:signal peptidase II
MGLALILGGTLGNMLDRARIGSVIDFVYVYYKARSFAVFNFADAAITVGVIATMASPIWRRLAKKGYRGPAKSQTARK